MTIEIYEGHAFLIKDIKKLAKLYACVDCQARCTVEDHVSIPRLSSVFPNNRDEFASDGQAREENICDSLASASLRNGNSRPRKRGALSPKSKQKPIRTLSSMTLNRTTTKRGKTRSPPHSRAILASVSDTLECEPTHICDPNSKELIQKFLEELVRRGKNIRTTVREAFMPEDMKAVCPD